MASKLKLNRKAVGAFLKSNEVQQAIEKQAGPIRDRAEANARASAKRSDEVEVQIKSYLGHDRARVHVSMTSPAAIRAEITDRALTRAKGTGG